MVMFVVGWFVVDRLSTYRFRMDDGCFVSCCGSSNSNPCQTRRDSASVGAVRVLDGIKRSRESG